MIESSGMTKRFNVLLVMTDQQRWNSLGCYGANWVSTPNLDRLASEGTRFENCYANNPICTPARASLMTGLELPEHGVYQLHDVLHRGAILFPERLRTLGFRTALFGKLHVSGRVEEAVRRHPNDGFDIYEWCLEPAVDIESPFNGYTGWLDREHPEYLTKLREKRRHRGHDPVEVSMNRWAADRSIDFIKSHQASGTTQPFFCKMSLFDPHNPYENYPLEMAQHVNSAGIPPLIKAAPAARGPVPWAFEAERENSYLGSFQSMSAESVQAMRVGYYAMIGHIDREIGRVLDALDESGAAEQTLVIFTSDHGDMLGDHESLVKGAILFDQCIRVPLIIRGGEFVGGRQASGLVQLHDIAATTLRHAGASPAELQAWMPSSRDITPLATGEVAEVHPFVVCTYRNSGINKSGLPWEPPIHATMVRANRYKLHIYHPVIPHQEDTLYQLFDLEDDPDEQFNLANDPAFEPVLARLRHAFVEWLTAMELRQGGRGGTATPTPDQLIVNLIT